MRTDVMNRLPLLLAACLFCGCGNKPDPAKVVRLATTTSVRDTGLLDALSDAFQKDGRYTLQPIAVGSGQALQLARTGEADVLLAHSPDDELEFMAGGFGSARVQLFHNDFVLLGPAADPAGIKSTKNIAEAFRKLAAAGAPFASRADKSGTHKKELALWKAAAARPAGDRYIETGQGMSATISIAEEKNAYCLSDRATYLSMKKNVRLVITAEGGEALINRYSVILVTAARFPKVNAAGAKAFFDFMLSKPARDLIVNYGRDKYGQQLFFYDHRN